MIPGTNHPVHGTVRDRGVCGNAQARVDLGTGSGWRLGADETPPALVASSSPPCRIARRQGEFAITVEEFPSKIRISSRGDTEHLRFREDHDVVDRIRARFVKSMPTHADAPSRYEGFIMQPSMAGFEVREVFLQTPGPGAGTRLVPPAEP